MKSLYGLEMKLWLLKQFNVRPVKTTIPFKGILENVST